MITEDTIRQAVATLVEAASPERVVLFGSYARGDAGADSDLDFLVVEHQVTDRASYQQPTQVSTGIDAVYVNGVLACKEGGTVNAHAGRVLRRGGHSNYHVMPTALQTA